MTEPKFLQIHTLHSYPAALLNRDASGLAKRMPFGGATRTRVSSQCLKRHWRVAEDDFALANIDGAADAIRSRNVVDRSIIQPLRAGGDLSDEVIDAVRDAFNVEVYGSGGASESGRQPLLLGLPEVEYLQKKARAICAEHAEDDKAAGEAAKLLFQPARRNEERDNFAAFRQQATLPGGLIGALFGRMVTSDPGANIEAAVHVAHAFTVHREESESDYFSVVDDLQRDDEDAGAAHIGDVELTAGLFYSYVVVDIPGLVSNLKGLRGGGLAERGPRACGQGGRAPHPPDRHGVAGGETRLHRSLRIRGPDAGRGGVEAAPQSRQRLPGARAGTGRGRHQTPLKLPRQAGHLLWGEGSAPCHVGRRLRNPELRASVPRRSRVMGRRRRPRREGGVNHATPDTQPRIAAHGVRRRDHRQLRRHPFVPCRVHAHRPVCQRPRLAAH